MPHGVAEKNKKYMVGPGLTPGAFNCEATPPILGWPHAAPGLSVRTAADPRPLVPGAMQPSAHDKAKADGVPARLPWSRATSESGELGE